MMHRKLILAASLTIAIPGFAQTFDATPATQAGDFALPYDATPDPAGNTYYFIAIGPGGPTVFKVPAAGGAAVPVVAGSPLVSPTGITISNDGQSLYVADPFAYAGNGRLGQIFVVPVTGGPVKPLIGAGGRRARAIEAAASGSIYFTGISADGLTSGIYSITPDSGAITTILEGTQLNQPQGVAVGNDGSVYFTDTLPNSTLAAVYKVDPFGAVSTVIETMRHGAPAGLALTQDGSMLLVSSIQPYKTRAQVLAVDLNTLETAAFSKTIGSNGGAGGIHRARNAEAFAWCGVTVGNGGSGTVFHITLK